MTFPRLTLGRHAQVTANLASVASVGQTMVNLLLTPFLLRVLGVSAALLVTPTAYIAGESLIMSAQTVTTVFVCRSMDFIFRCEHARGCRARVPRLAPRKRGRAVLLTEAAEIVSCGCARRLAAFPCPRLDACAPAIQVYRLGQHEADPVQERAARAAH